MSDAERAYEARRKQGKLTPEQRVELKSDLLRLLNSKMYPKSDSQLSYELIKNCGWERDKINGPRPFVSDALDELEAQGLIESRTQRDENSGGGVGLHRTTLYWKKARG